MSIFQKMDIIPEDIQIDKIKNMAKDINDENFIFTKKEECSIFLDKVPKILEMYIKAKSEFCKSLEKIKEKLNELTENKSTTLKSTFIYKFTKMMSCYVNDFLSSSFLKDAKDLSSIVKEFKEELLNMDDKEKNDTNYKKLKKEYYNLYEDGNKIMKKRIEEAKKIGLQDKKRFFDFMDNLQEEEKNMQKRENNLKYGENKKMFVDMISEKKFEYNKENKKKCKIIELSNNIMGVINKIITNSKKNSEVLQNDFIKFEEEAKYFNKLLENKKEKEKEYKKENYAVDIKRDFKNIINKYEPFKWQIIDTLKKEINENTLSYYAQLGLGMIDISEFKKEKIYLYLIEKLLWYDSGFEGQNISDPDIIELIEISKDQNIMNNLFNLLIKYMQSNKCKCSIRVFSAISEILLNYLDLLQDLLPCDGDDGINFEIFRRFNYIIDSFYTIKDNILQITLFDNVKDHKILKNKDFWNKFFSFINKNNPQNIIAINECSFAMLQYGFKKLELEEFFNIKELNEKDKENIKVSFEKNVDFIIENKNFNYVRFILWKLFSSLSNGKDGEKKISITKNEKNKFYDFIKDNLDYLSFIFEFFKENRSYRRLDKERFDIINEIFKIILDYILKNIETSSEKELKGFIKTINMLASSYSFENTYINSLDNFKKHDLFKNLNYWKKYLSYLLEESEGKNVDISFSIYMFITTALEFLKEEDIKKVITSEESIFKSGKYSEKEMNEQIEKAKKSKIK